METSLLRQTSIYVALNCEKVYYEAIECLIALVKIRVQFN